MVGKTANATQGVRRPPPLPPASKPPPSAPAIYAESTMTSAAPVKKSKRSCWSECHFKQLWQTFVNKIRSLFRSCMSLFQRNQAPVAQKKIETANFLKVGQQHAFLIEGCEHLSYLVRLNNVHELELLGFYFVTKGEGGKKEYKTIDSLNDADREIAYDEMDQINSAFFQKLLQAILTWAQTNNFLGTVERKIDANDVWFIGDYVLFLFDVVNDEEDLTAFTTELQAFKARFQGVLFDRNGRPKNSFRFTRFSRQTQADLMRFRRMLEFKTENASQIEDKQLHEHWDFWETFNRGVGGPGFQREHQIALHLDHGEQIPPALFHGMSVTYEID